MAKKLLDQVREIARLKHLSHRTEESYIHWIHPVRYYFDNFRIYIESLSHGIKRFILFHNKRHPTCPPCLLAGGNGRKRDSAISYLSR